MKTCVIICSVALLFVSQIQEGKGGGGCSARPNSQVIQGECYWTTGSEDTWFAARAACYSDGGDLASFHSGSQYDEVAAAYVDGAGVKKFWVGLYYEASADNEGWAWSDESLTNYHLFDSKSDREEPQIDNCKGCGVVVKKFMRTRNCEPGSQNMKVVGLCWYPPHWDR